MAKSECFCSIDQHHGYSCEQTVNPNTRFRFDKEDDVIIGGREVPNDIANCELKCRVQFKDKETYFKELEAQPRKHHRHHRGHHGVRH